MFFFSAHAIYAQNFKSPLSSSEVFDRLQSRLESSQEVIQWKNVDNHLLWSTINSQDKMVSIGYKPSSESNIKSRIHTIDTNKQEWTNAKEKIINFIVSESQAKYGNQITRESLIPKGKQNDLPYLNIKVLDREIMEEVMQMPEVRYFEPKSNPDFGKRLKSDSGCSSGVSNVSGSDYTTITPQSLQSWHHDKHNIPCAWTNSNKGDGIWIAVMDTGISSAQDKLNSEFAVGQSTGRVVEKYNTFQTNGVSTSNWQDQCGHGTSMSGLAVAPRGFDNMPAGVAYKSNLISYRVTEDVVINTGDEKDGVTEALYHAGNDPRLNIISMSIGDVFSSGQVEDAINYAYNNGKLIFAAAGTSTSITNWYPVIFPAWLSQTVAVTGIKDGSNRQRCSSCHDGPEVDFVVEMQRSSDNDRTAVTLAMPNNDNGYVGGSSAATATMAGIAGLVWGNNPTWSRVNVLTRLIQSADGYPTRDNDFGWGAVDVCAAVDNNFSLVCSTGVTNDVTMQITNINFPPESDTGSEAEWVIRFNGAAHFFDVSVNGASGDPANFIDVNQCGSVPIIVDLGMTNCGQSSLPVTINIHEDDGASSDCTLNGFPANDDDYGTTTPSVSFNSNTFSTNGFTFTYQLICTSSLTPPAAGLSVPQDTCINSIADVEFFATGGTGPYTVTYSENGGATQSLTLSPNSGSIPINTNATGNMSYTLLSVTDANGCGQALSQSETVVIHPIPTISATGIDPTVCGGADGQISIAVTNVPDGVYDITYSAGVFTGISVVSGVATVSNLASGIYDDLLIVANTCESTELPDIVLLDPVLTIAASSTDPTSCGGMDGQISITVTNVPDGNYSITYLGGVFTSVSVVSGSAIISNVPAGNYDDLEILVNTCSSTQFPDVVLVDPVLTGISIASNAPQCPGSMTTVQVLPSGNTDYTFYIDANTNGMMDSGEQVQTGTNNMYSSSSFVDGDVLGVIVTGTNNCIDSYFEVISTLPLDYAFAGSGGLIGTELGIADYETDGILESTQTIDFSAIVDYDSAIEVHLLPGFETVLGAQFEAFIDGCNGGLGGLN